MDDSLDYSCLNLLNCLCAGPTEHLSDCCTLLWVCLATHQWRAFAVHGSTKFAKSRLEPLLSMSRLVGEPLSQVYYSLRHSVRSCDWSPCSPQRIVQLKQTCIVLYMYLSLRYLSFCLFLSFTRNNWCTWLYKYAHLQEQSLAYGAYYIAWNTVGVKTACEKALY